LAQNTESELERVLEHGIDEQLRPHLPRLLIKADNARGWREWISPRRDALSRWLKQREAFTDGWMEDLETYAGGKCERLDFVPAAVANDWLKEKQVGVEDLGQALKSIAPSFKNVTAKPCELATMGWRKGKGHHAAFSGGPEKKLEVLELIEASMVCGAWGDAAEKALLAWVEEETRRLLKKEDANNVLLGVFPEASQTRKKVHGFLATDLNAALHIARLWSGAGFDVLGLQEKTDGQVEPVRYECKAIGASGNTLRVHLTRRELAVARKVWRDKGPGVWRLVGVEPSGRCVDLTPLIEDILDDEAKPLAPLHEQGLEPDGLRLVIERGSPSAGENKQSG
jgi:hypothetical protein